MTGDLYIKTAAISALPSNATGRTATLPVSGNYGVWVDAYTRYGVTLDEKALSLLMTPAPSKEIVENKSDLQDGKRVYRDADDVKKDERNVTFIINISARNNSTFLSNYGLFCQEVLNQGFIDLYVTKLPNTTFRLTFLNCTQFSQFVMGVGKFSLQMNEPDPTNRGMTDSWNAVYTYTAVSTSSTGYSTKNPKSEGWYERTGVSPDYYYRKTWDSTPYSGKTYYTRSIST